MKTVLILLTFVQHFLLMSPIQDSIISGDYDKFEKVCATTVSVNMEEPVKLEGNYKKDRFINKLHMQMNRFKVEKLKWISKHIWEDFAVQSLDLELRNIRNGKDEFYKLIFFMKREKKEWTLYYLRGISL